MARSEENQAEARRPCNGLRSTLYAKFAEDGAQVKLDRVVTDVECICYRLVWQPLCQAPKHLKLSPSQFLCRIQGRLLTGTVYYIDKRGVHRHQSLSRSSQSCQQLRSLSVP